MHVAPVDVAVLVDSLDAQHCLSNVEPSLLLTQDVFAHQKSLHMGAWGHDQSFCMGAWVLGGMTRVCAWVHGCLGTHERISSTIRYKHVHETINKRSTKETKKPHRSQPHTCI